MTILPTTSSARHTGTYDWSPMMPNNQQIATVTTHWDHVTNSGAGMAFPDDNSNLLINTKEMDTTKYSATMPAI
jgi:hypothetical protein